MRILLVQPPKAPRSLGGEDFYMYEPLSLEYVAAGVVADHDVRLVDLRLEPDLDAVLAEFAPDVVGLTAYTVHANTTLALCQRVKALRPEALTVVGGHHATVRPADFARPGVDLVVAGEGVAAFREIVARRDRGRDQGGVPGVFQVDGAELRGEPAPLPTALASTPRPVRALGARYRHRYFSEWMKPIATIRTSKGCPFRCTFCALWRLTGGRYLKREPEDIVDELRGVAEPNVFFADDESMVNVKGLDRLADLIAQERILKRFFFYGRADTINRHPELLAKWRDIGLARLFVGLESFRDADLAAVNKKTSVADNERALRSLDALGIEPYASFIVRPDFTREDFRAFRAWCRSMPLSFAGFSVLTPLPGTQLFEETEAQLLTRDWDFFDFLHTVLPTRLPLPEFFREYADLIGHAITPGRALSFLGRFPLHEMPGMMRRSFALLRRIRAAHRDYAALA